MPATRHNKRSSCWAMTSMEPLPPLLMVDSSSEPFLPAFASEEEKATILSWEDGAVVARAISSIPAVDVDYLLASGTGTEDSRLRWFLAYTRLSNRICHGCEWKPAPDRRHHNRLRLCGACCLAWFCSDECRERAHARTHSKGTSKHLLRCKTDASGPLDDGPMCIVVTHLRKEERVRNEAKDVL